MIRGVLRAFSTRFPAPVFARCSQNLNGTGTSLSKQLIKKPSSATFASLLPSVPTFKASIENISYCSKNSFLKARPVSLQQSRSVIKFCWKRGKKQTDDVVLTKFFRLHWGIWIRTIAGRHKKLWKKSGIQKRRYLQHVFCNATQSRMLDKMVTNYWRKPKYYIEDPYEPYHKREEFTITRRKPWRPEGCDYE